MLGGGPKPSSPLPNGGFRTWVIKRSFIS
jgi:hypothetical protein